MAEPSIINELKTWRRRSGGGSNTTLGKQISLLTKSINIGDELLYIFPEKLILIKYRDDFSLIFLQPSQDDMVYQLRRTHNGKSYTINCREFMLKLKEAGIKMKRYTPELVEGGLLIRTEKMD